MKIFRPLLTMKHWQWFTVLIGGIAVFEFIMFASIFSTVGQNKEPEPSTFAPLFSILPLLMIFTLYFSNGWQWAIIDLLRNKMPKEVKAKFNHKRIKIFFWLPIIYLLVIVLAVTYFAFTILNHPDPEHFFGNDQEPPAILFVLPVLIFPVHLFAIFCMFHSIYFAAKTLKTVELQKEVKFDEFAAEFFLIWFNIIGIWILQPRLNKLIKGEGIENNESDILDDVGEEIV